MIIYDFWITDKMIQNEEYTKWYQEQYLVKFPKPYRKENEWNQDDLAESFIMEKKVKYCLEYDFLIEDFVDFMMIQSNVNEVIEKGYMSVEEVKQWMNESLQTIFTKEKKTLLFQGNNWYIRRI